MNFTQKSKIPKPLIYSITSAQIVPKLDLVNNTRNSIFYEYCICMKYDNMTASNFTKSSGNKTTVFKSTELIIRFLAGLQSYADNLANSSSKFQIEFNTNFNISGLNPSYQALGNILSNAVYFEQDLYRIAFAINFTIFIDISLSGISNCTMISESISEMLKNTGLELNILMLNVYNLMAIQNDTNSLIYLLNSTIALTDNTIYVFENVIKALSTEIGCYSNYSQIAITALQTFQPALNETKILLGNIIQIVAFNLNNTKDILINNLTKQFGLAQCDEQSIFDFELEIPNLLNEWLLENASYWKDQQADYLKNFSCNFNMSEGNLTIVINLINKLRLDTESLQDLIDLTYFSYYYTSNLLTRNDNLHNVSNITALARQFETISGKIGSLANDLVNLAIALNNSSLNITVMFTNAIEHANELEDLDELELDILSFKTSKIEEDILEGADDIKEALENFFCVIGKFYFSKNCILHTTHSNNGKTQTSRVNTRTSLSTNTTSNFIPSSSNVMTSTKTVLYNIWSDWSVWQNCVLIRTKYSQLRNHSITENISVSCDLIRN
jgi:hypothetical protein